MHFQMTTLCWATSVAILHYELDSAVSLSPTISSLYSLLDETPK